MKKFSDLGIKPVDDRKIFNCNQVSITDVVNCEIEVLGYISNVKTQHGDGRCLAHYKYNGVEGKFFSNSTSIKNALDQIDEQNFPFSTIIRCAKCGSGKIYQFT
ncbi:MAG: hypothetical protein LBU37_02270 [Tannerellaceae bacterium]|jgi:hypothetical protein|nr:hypothetical protein [Tannerellaceae bacterium]